MIRCNAMPPGITWESSRCVREAGHKENHLAGSAHGYEWRDKAPAKFEPLTVDDFCALALWAIRRIDLVALHWRHHGLGMLQGEISYDWRVHIWHPKLRTIPSDGYRAVHDHRFRIKSAVLVGAVIDHRKVVDIRHDGGGVTDVWKIKHAKVQDQTAAVAELIGRADVFSDQPRTYRAGESYEIPRRVWHTTEVEDFAVTLIRRDDFDEDDARVLGNGHSAIVGIHSPFYDSEMYATLVDRARSDLHRKSKEQP